MTDRALLWVIDVEAVEVVGGLIVQQPQIEGSDVLERDPVPELSHRDHGVPGLRLQRAVLASSHDGSLYVDSLKGRRARTVPLPAAGHEVVQRWADGRAADEELFAAPEGGPLSESKWKRSIGWSPATAAIGRPTLRPHDLRHTGGTARPPRQRKGPLDRSRMGLTCAEALEPPKGIEPLTYSLRVNRSGRLS